MTDESNDDRVTWLHLTDLHRGQPGDRRWNQQKHELLRDMEFMSARLGPPDLVLLTGDLAFKGAAAEYKLVDETLDEIFAVLGTAPVVVPVPGNHDLARDMLSATERAGLLSYSRLTSSGEDVRAELHKTWGDETTPVMATIRRCFANYTAWFTERIEPTWQERDWAYDLGPLPGDFRLTVERFGLRLGIAGVNSAYLDTSDEIVAGLVAIEAFQLGEDVRGWAAGCHGSLLLHHHPPDWIARFANYPTDVYPPDLFLACLCGHLHASEARDERTPVGERRCRQAASLLGLERYLRATEDRVLGYDWGRLEMTAPAEGVLSWWPRRFYEASGGGLQVRVAPSEDPFRAPVRLNSSTSPRLRMPGSAFRPVLSAHLNTQHERGRDLFAQGDYVTARGTFLEVLTSASSPDNDEDLAQLAERARVNAAICLLLLGRADEASAEFDELDASHLPESGRANAAQALAQLGRTEDAKQLIAGLAASDDLRIAEELISLAEGAVPLAPSTPFTQARAALNLVVAGKLETGVEWALSAKDETCDVSVRAHVVEALLAAGEASIFAPNGPTLSRESAKMCVTALLGLLAEPELREHVGGTQCLQWEARFALLSDDTVSFRDATAELRAAGSSDTSFGGRLRLVSDRSSDEPTRDEPVAGETVRIDGPRFRRVTDQASECLLQGDAIAAVAHAESARDMWPGHGQRLLLARCLLAAGRPEAAEAELIGVDTTRDAVAAHVRASTGSALQLEPPELLERWRAFERLRPDTPQAVLNVGLALYFSGDVDAAAEKVRPLVGTTALESLGVEYFRPVAALIAAASTPEATATVVRRMARVAFERSSGAPQFAAAYAGLWHQLGAPRDLPPPDLAALAAEGVAVAVEVSEAVAQIRRGIERRRAIASQYELGQVPFEALVEELGESTSQVVARAAGAGGHGLVCALPLPGARSDITGAHVITGYLELLLLAEFGCLDAFERKLGPAGRLVLFRDVYARLQQDSLQAAIKAERIVQGPLDQVVSAAREARKLGTTDAAGEDADAAWAAKHNLVLVVDAPSEEEPTVGTLTLRQFAHEMLARRLIPQVAHARLFLDESQPRTGSRNLAQYSGFALDAVSCSQLLEAGALQHLIRSQEAGVYLAPSAAADLEARRAACRDAHRAHRLADAVLRLVGRLARSGRLKLISRPVVDLPPVRPGHYEGVATWVGQAMSWLEATHQESGSLLLCADLLGAGLMLGSVPVPLMSAFDWNHPDTPDYRRLLDRRHGLVNARLSFGRVVRSLSTADPTALREKLLSWGLTDVLDAADVLELVREWGALDAEVPRRLLDLVEAQSASRALRRSASVPIAAAHLYAQSIWRGWAELERDDAVGLTTVLLSRCEAMPATVGAPAIESIFDLLIALSIADPERSFTRSENGDSYNLGGEGNASVGLWETVRDWISRSQSTREPLFRNAYVRALLEIQAPVDGATAGVLLLVAMEAERSKRSIEVLSPGGAMESLSIASQRWATKPLSGVRYSLSVDGEEFSVSHEELLALAAEAVRDSVEFVDFGCAVRVPVKGKELDLIVPAEAVALQTDDETTPKLAAALADVLEADDAIEAAALRALADNPSSEDARDAVVKAALEAPWRRVRVDALDVLRWGMVVADQPATISDLRRVLGEPGALAADSLVEELSARLNGAWRTSPSLLLSAAAVPGDCSFLLFMLKARSWGDELLDGLDAALDVLRKPHGQPVGHLVQALHLVGVAGLLVKERADDLQQAVSELVRSLSAPTPDSSLAALEPRLLQASAATVRRLWGPPLPAPDYVWLAWRLYQWLLNQALASVSTSPAEHLAPLAAIALEAPPATSSMLDPGWFGQSRFDHRLGSTLHVLCRLGDRALDAIASPELHEQLVGLGARERTEAERLLESASGLAIDLGWGDAPRSVPGLAARVVQRIEDLAKAEPSAPDLSGAQKPSTSEKPATDEEE